MHQIDKSPAVIRRTRQLQLLRGLLGEAFPGRLVEGGVADLCLFDPGPRTRLDPATLRSQSRHTPFAGHTLPGRVAATIVAGNVAHDASPHSCLSFS